MAKQSNKEYIESILSEAEKGKLESLNQDTILREAIKKVLLAPIYQDGTLKKGVPANPLKNFLLGAIQSAGELEPGAFRAYVAAKAEAALWVERAFMELENFVKVEEQQPKENNAR